MNLTTKTTMAATVLLLVAALVLSVRNHTELKAAKMQNDTLTAQLTARNQGGQFAAPASINADLEDRLAKIENATQTKNAEIARLQGELEATRIEQAENTVVTDLVDQRLREEEKELTPLQKKILAAAAIGDVSGVNEEWGFVTINAGASQGVEPGSVFAIRREKYIIGRVKIETAEKDSSVGNMEPGSMAPGFRIEAGDSVISYPIF